MMKYILVILIVFIAFKKSILQRTGNRYLCVKRADGTCRPVRTENDIDTLNQQFLTVDRYWSLTSRSECGDNWSLNQLGFCKSICDKVRNDNFADFDCSRDELICLANDKTNRCAVFSDKCQAAAEACNIYPQDAYIAQNFRCERNRLTEAGQTGVCYPKLTNNN